MVEPQRQIFFIAALLANLVELGSAHFVLQYPTSIGYTDSLQGTAPCGSYDPTDQFTGVTNWPLGGNTVKVISTHDDVVWEFNAALLSAPTDWVKLTPQLSQTSVGHFCEPQIPGNADWNGEDALLQVVQHTRHGSLYACVSITFTYGVAMTPPSVCTNGTGVAAEWL